MSDYSFVERDFEHPSVLFTLEDKLKGLLGGPLLYNPYFKTFSLKGNERVLDFGCGGGAGSKFLAKLLNKGGHLTCVDVSNYWINRAKKRLQRYSNVECKSGDIRDMGIPDSSFDIISIIHVIHDIPPEERQDITEELSRVLMESGQLFIREPIKESHGMPVAEIRTLLTESGLRETHYQVNKSEYLGEYQKVG